jgi:hypothetical protein
MIFFYVFLHSIYQKSFLQKNIKNVYSFFAYAPYAVLFSRFYFQLNFVYLIPTK